MMAGKAATPRWDYWVRRDTLTLWEGVNLCFGQEPIPTDKYDTDPRKDADVRELFAENFRDAKTVQAALDLYDFAKDAIDSYRIFGEGLPTMGIRGIPSRWIGNIRVRTRDFFQLAEQKGFGIPHELRSVCAPNAGAAADDNFSVPDDDAEKDWPKDKKPYDFDPILQRRANAIAVRQHASGLSTTLTGVANKLFAELKRSQDHGSGLSIDSVERRIKAKFWKRLLPASGDEPN